MSEITGEKMQDIYDAAVRVEFNEKQGKSEDATFDFLCVMGADLAEVSATVRKLIDMVRARDAELLAVREAQPKYDEVQRSMMKDIVVRKLGSNLLGEKLVMADIHAVTMALMDAGFRLAAAPPAPAVPDDTRRMDWLVAHHVEVRKPLLYGSEKFFTAQTMTDEEDDYHATSLREQIDAAMAAAPTPTK